MTRFATALALAATLALAGPAHAVDFAVGNFATELEPAHTCTLSEAKGIAVHNRVKPVFTLPQADGMFRLIGTSTDTGKYVGAAIAVAGCGFTLVTELGMKRPWCEYLPAEQRCPTSLAQ